MNRNRTRGILVVGLVGGCYSPNTPGGSGDGGETTAAGSESSGGLDATTPVDSSVSATNSDPTSTTAATSSPTDPSDPSDTEGDSTDGGPFCGDGVVDPDEVCDDGVNDSSYGSCTADCGGFGPRCGDDVIQGEEFCDDGNDVDGDGCNTDCVESGSLLWTVVFDDGAMDGTATSVAPSPDGDIYLVGGGVLDWVRRLDAAGAEVWSVPYSFDRPEGVAVDDDGVVYVAGGSGRAVYNDAGELLLEDPTTYRVWDGAVSADGNAVTVGTVSCCTTAWLSRFGQDGETLWTELEPSDGADAAWGVAVDGEESIVVAGQKGVVPTLLDSWIKKYDANGAELWSHTYNSIVGNSSGDNFQAVDTGPDNEVAAAGGFGSFQSMDVWIGRFSADGDLSWSDTFSSPNGPIFAADVTVDATGNVIVVATVPTADAEATRVWVRKYAAAGVVLWTQEFSVDDGDAASSTVEGVAVDAMGGIFVVGASSTGGDTDPWVGKISA